MTNNAGQAAPPVMPGDVHQFTSFPVVVAILLHFCTCGLFSIIWLTLMHGKLPKIRSDDPSGGKALGFCFIPFYNLYWIFFIHRRLCLRVDEQRETYGLPPSNLQGMATTMSVFSVIPYINFLIGFPIISPIFLGMMQSSVNQLAKTSATTGPRRTVPTQTVPAGGMPAWAIVLVAFGSIAFIGLLAAIAIPNFVKARITAQTNVCINNLHDLERAKNQWASATGNSSTPTMEDLSPYLRQSVLCPANGHYIINEIGTDPMCDVKGHQLHEQNLSQ